MENNFSSNLLCKVVIFLISTLERVPENLQAHLKSSRSFVRSEKLSLIRMVFLLLSGFKHSIQYELIRFSKELDAEKVASKSAFVQSRHKIKGSFFKVLSDLTMQEFASSMDKRIKGYRMIAADGSTLAPPNTAGCREHFGTVKNQHGSQCLARWLCLYDVENELMIDKVLGQSKSSELTLLTSVLGSTTIPEKSMFILDRFYNSTGLMSELIKRGHGFVIRMKSNFTTQSRVFIQSGMLEQIVEMKLTHRARQQLKLANFTLKKGETMKVRMIRIEKENSEPIFLITSDLDVFTVDEIHSIYRQRWGVETAIDMLKNKFRMEDFAGHCPDFIVQEFELISLRHYLVSVLKKDIQTSSEKKQEPRNTQHEYQLNNSLIIPLLNILLLQIADKPDANIQDYLSFCIQNLIRFKEPIRPNRVAKRIRKQKKARGRCHYNQNYKFVS